MRHAAGLTVGAVLAALLVASLTACGRDQAAQGPEADMGAAPAAPTEPEPRTIPILCMHDLGPNAQNAYSVKSADLEQYLKWLHDEGFRTVTVRDVAAYLRGEGQLPEKPIVLTFDDNWKSALTIAEPMMEPYGYVGVAFLIASSVGANDKRLTWDDCNALAEAGWEIGSHSKTHENLTSVKQGQSPDSIRDMVDDQIRDSKDTIEENTGLEVTSFAHPFGNYDTFVCETLEDAGYTAAVSIDRATADEQSNPFCLPRRMVMNATRFETLKELCQKKALHVADLDPEAGARVAARSVTITGRLTDGDVAAPPTAEVHASETRAADVSLDPATRKLTIHAELSRGANAIVLRAPGREVSWLLISDA